MIGIRPPPDADIKPMVGAASAVPNDRRDVFRSGRFCLPGKPLT